MIPIIPIIPPNSVYAGKIRKKNSDRLCILVEMLPPDYTKAVLEEYRRKKAANSLPHNMRQLTPARFKAACKEVRKAGYCRKDEPLLKTFFGEASDQNACLDAIVGCDIDIFRPLINFLKKKTMNPDDRHVELLAWLIDFKERPCDYEKDYAPQSGDTSESPQGPPIDETSTVKPAEPEKMEREIKPISSAPGERKRNRVWIVLTASLFILAGIVLYRILPVKPSTPPGPQACMFWADDHYEPVNCNERKENIQVIALDSQKLIHFRKITRPDTITSNARGSVWYVRYRGNYEYYTSEGFHPIDPQLRLRPLTDYIIARHVPANP